MIKNSILLIAMLFGANYAHAQSSDDLGTLRRRMNEAREVIKDFEGTPYYRNRLDEYQDAWRLYATKKGVEEAIEQFFASGGRNLADLRNYGPYIKAQKDYEIAQGLVGDPASTSGPGPVTGNGEPPSYQPGPPAASGDAGVEIAALKAEMDEAYLQYIAMEQQNPRNAPQLLTAYFTARNAYQMAGGR